MNIEYHNELPFVKLSDLQKSPLIDFNDLECALNAENIPVEQYVNWFENGEQGTFCRVYDTLFVKTDTVAIVDLNS